MDLYFGSGHYFKLHCLTSALLKFSFHIVFGVSMIAITQLENHILELPRQDFAKLRDLMLALNDTKSTA